MQPDDDRLQRMTSERRQGPPDARLIASTADWSLCEYTCHAGPRDRPFEERHERFTIAAVVEGSFIYRTGAGRALVQTGAWLLGNQHASFECGHDHRTGDRCIAFHFSPAFFSEISASAAAQSCYRFPVAALPAIKHLMPTMAGLEGVANGAPTPYIDETVTQLAEIIISTSSGHSVSPVRVLARDERRIADVLRHVETHASEPLDLVGLAGVAGVSKYHFLRIFRRTVGMTPYQFLLTVRMRRAATRLSTTTEPVAAIVFDTGFGDLSTFNRRFYDVFGMTPSAYRRCGGDSVLRRLPCQPNSRAASRRLLLM